MELDSYRGCIGQQLEELELLNSIYCNAGEFQLLDAGVIADFNEFLASESSPDTLRSHLEYIIKLSLPGKQNVDVRIELPHLYPLVELARISVNTTLLGKIKEQQLKMDITNYLEEQGKAEEPYIYQLLSWLQEHIEALLLRPELDTAPTEELKKTVQHLERLWIMSHHIKSTAKRQEIIRQARQLELTGFSRPGKPGIICVEGKSEQVQEYWRTIKALRWQKISLVKTEQRQRKRFFENFSEQLFDDNDVMNMGQFIKFLEAHGAGYMKSELFGLQLD